MVLSLQSSLLHNINTWKIKFQAFLKSKILKNLLLNVQDALTNRNDDHGRDHKVQTVAGDEG